MNNIMQGISALSKGNWKDLEAYTEGEVLFDEEDGSATIWYGDQDYSLSELDEHTLYKIMQEEGVPDNMIPSLDKLRTYFEQPKKESPKQQTASDLIAKYSN